jgi:hypothetical protein
MLVVERLREAAAGGVLDADVERPLRARAEHRRGELFTERRHLTPVVAKLLAEGRRLLEKIGEASSTTQRLLDQRIAEVGAEAGRAEQRLAEVERALAAVEHAKIETRWVLPRCPGTAHRCRRARAPQG